MWICKGCHEEVDDDFDVCWNCTVSKDGVPLEIQKEKKLSAELANLQAQLAKSSEADLLRIVNVDYKNYREDAVLMARNELERRNVSMYPFVKVCANCKADLDDNAVFCPACGTSKDPFEKTELSGIRCEACNTTIEEDAKFCPECRKPVTKDGMIECPNCKKQVLSSSKFCKYCAGEMTSRISVKNKQVSGGSNFVTLGLIIAVCSAIAFFWGQSYRNNWQNAARAGLGNLIGQQDSTYMLAEFAVVIGTLGVVIGVILFIVGLAKRK